jgi:gliding motility-associated-like protein
MKKIALYFASLLSFSYFSQSAWKQDFSTSKVFIENKGQFDVNENEATGKIEFAADFGTTRVFFGKSGISYSFLEAKKVPRDERAHLEAKVALKNPKDYKQWEKLIGKYHYRADEVNMIWNNSSCRNIEAIGKRKDYHSYAFRSKSGEIKNVNYVGGYEKIIYKNIYPKIDIEYAIHPKEGLKYAVILHPGAQVEDIQMIYDRSVRIEDGKVKVSTLFGDIVDHEPYTFYEKDMRSVIESSFIQIGKKVQFQLDSYDRGQTLIIDPWTQTPLFPSNWDCTWEVEKDASGNVYAIGGILPMQLLKYNEAGNLLWTFNTPYDTVGGWLGGLATSDIGESFICNGSSAKIMSVNTNGGLNWSNDNPSGAGFASEFWTISFNCDQSKLVIGGAKLQGLNPSPWIYDVNMTNGNILASLQVTPPPTGFGAGHEVRALTECDNDKYYYLTHDTIGYINSNLNACGSLGASNVKIGSGHNLSYKCENFREGNAGIQALKTFGDFVFVHRGDIVEKRNFNTGAIVQSVTIPGGSFINTTVFGITTRQVGCSGIDIDNCGNVYVGALNSVVKFNQNLVFQASYPTSFRVYDVHVSNNGNIVAGGSTGTNSDNTRSGGIQQINAIACPPLPISCCNASICPVPNLCVIDAPVVLTASTAGGIWSGPGMSANGTFNPATAGVGTHTITYTLSCGSETQTIVVSPCQSISVCIESNGTYTVSNGVAPYSWQSQTTVQNCSACLFGCAFPPGCAVNVLTWTTYTTGSNVSPPTSFPIRVLDNSGTEIIINSAAELQPCNSSGCPTLMSITNSTNVSCFGLTDGSGSVTTSGGSAPYTYTWSGAGATLTGASQNNLAAGIYVITILDADSCSSTATINIIEPAQITLQSNNINPADCNESNGSGSILASGGTGSLSYSWSPNGGNLFSAFSLSAGIYTVTVEDINGCTEDIEVIIPSIGGPSITAIEVENPLCFGESSGQIVVTASGGTGSLTYQLGNGAPQSSPVFTNLVAGTYQTTVSDANNCAITQTVSITNPNEVVAAITLNDTICIGQSVSLSGSGSGGTGLITISWSNGLTGINPSVSPTQSTSYTITATDANGCSDSEITTITVLPIPNAAASPQNLTGYTPLVVNFSNNSTNAFNYTWSFGNGQNQTTTSNTGVTTTYNESGTYSVTLIASNGLCSDSWDGSITVLPIGEMTFEVPNVFSPNEDGSNDFYGISSINASSQEAGIYNRWGNLMVELNEPNAVWDGTVNGNNAAEGVYFLKYKIVGINGVEKEGQSFIHLIRK